MRQGQNKRSRGRGRKHQNHANRTLDSNGPDVKIRGSATQIFEKYQNLARDAQAAGDRVAAENYLQHAEHYYRIILANQPTGEGQTRQPFSQGGPLSNADEDFDGFDDEGSERMDGASAGEANSSGDGSADADAGDVQASDQQQSRRSRGRRRGRGGRDHEGGRQAQADSGSDSEGGSHDGESADEQIATA